MFLRLYLFIKNIVIGLPVIRSIPAFNTLPERITPYNLRFYKLCNLVHTLGMAVHLSWIFLFWYFGFFEIMYINIISFSVYVFNIVINRRGYHLTSATIMIVEIILHQIVAIKFFGWSTGFQHYILVISLFPFLMPKGNWAIKFFLLAACLCSYLLMDFLLKNEISYYVVHPNLVVYLAISNIIFAFTSMCISGAYFNIAMHETEVALEEKTIELIASEKKATLGQLATEMAHEIQNPLNFVNNLSEVNEELLADLKDELKQGEPTEETKYLLSLLFQNSESIKTNGKRISKIVSGLQEEVDKENVTT